MKFCLVIAGLLSLSLSVSAATNLKLSPNIDVLALDGKKMRGSLLKGADSLELNDGQHQLLFSVTKHIRNNSQTQILYTSAPLIVVFNSDDVSSVSIELPRIENESESQLFDQTMNYRMIDENGRALTIKRDVLPAHTLATHTNLEKIIADYNAEARPASLPELTALQNTTVKGQPSSAQADQNMMPPKKGAISEQMLQYWFLRADRQTQKRFIAWAEHHTTH